MLKRNDRPGDIHAGKWNGLGGKFEPGESPEECLYREVFEESGLRLERFHLKGVITFPMFDGKDDWYAFVYLGTLFSGNLRPSSEGELSWIPDHEVPELNLWPGDRVFLPWLEQERFFSAKLMYHDGAFKDYTVTFYPPAGAAVL
jgi:8-oxo-dGTP diphosphatase